jgi:hypothetical protein
LGLDEKKALIYAWHFYEVNQKKGLFLPSFKQKSAMSGFWLIKQSGDKKKAYQSELVNRDFYLHKVSNADASAL